ncbi:MAG: PhzF family phenazine biosynthesis protein [Alphaproteobacteria bacterium]
MTRNELPIYQIDAFSSELFGGNPAAVCPLTEWLDDAMMQSIAAENNLAQTAFFVAEGDGYRLRWFTPAVEVDLCGHATLAAAYVVLNLLKPARERVIFNTRSGPLEVWRDAVPGRLSMSLSAAESFPCAELAGMSEALGEKPDALLKSALNGGYVMAVFDSSGIVKRLTPDMAAIARLCNGLIATAPADEGTGHDIVSRFFAPAMGIPEDPVTGSAHSQLIPYWAKRLGRAEITAYQASARGGFLYCTNAGERVILRGDCALYLQGAVFI